MTKETPQQIFERKIDERTKYIAKILVETKKTKLFGTGFIVGSWLSFIVFSAVYYIWG